MKSYKTKTKSTKKELTDFIYAPGSLKISVGKLYTPNDQVWLCDFDKNTQKTINGGTKGTFISNENQDVVLVVRFIQSQNVVSLNHFIGWNPQTGVVVLYKNKLCLLESAELFGHWFHECPGQLQ